MKQHRLAVGNRCFECAGLKVDGSTLRLGAHRNKHRHARQSEQPGHEVCRKISQTRSPFLGRQKTQSETERSCSQTGSRLETQPSMTRCNPNRMLKPTAINAKGMIHLEFAAMLRKLVCRAEIASRVP
jgi:hypothetical protein